MEVYPLVDEQAVLRVPRRTEQQMIDELGSSGRVALATGHEVSMVTEIELRDLEAIEGFIGAFVPDTAPFPDLDLRGDFRYYSIQKRVTITQDLRICTERLAERRSRRSLERFIRDVREMVNSIGLLPDLAGKGNLVLDRTGLVKLIDINNFRRLVPNGELEKAMPTGDDLEACLLGHRSIAEFMPKDFIDDLGHPIADLSLAQLRSLEIRGLGRDPATINKRRLYAPLFNQTRQQVLALIRSVAA